MRLPRWLLVSLIAISALALLAVPAWLWVEMPRWTAERFAAAVEAKDADRTNRLLVNAVCATTTNPKAPVFADISVGGNPTLNLGRFRVVLTPRNNDDVLHGRQPMAMRFNNGNNIDRVTLIASWKTVTIDASKFAAALDQPKQIEREARKAELRKQRPQSPSE